jgi:DNA-binding Lrp family transcriptional regulator
MYAVFVQLKVEPGHLYKVADAIAEMEIFSEMYSTMGEYDLLLKIYVERIEELGELVTEKIHKVPHLRETKTILSFTTFKLPPVKS